MIKQIQKFLSEHTHGIMHTKQEAIYVLIIIVLVIILVASLVVKSLTA